MTHIHPNHLQPNTAILRHLLKEQGQVRPVIIRAINEGQADVVRIYTLVELYLLEAIKFTMGEKQFKEWFATQPPLPPPPQQNQRFQNSGMILDNEGQANWLKVARVLVDGTPQEVAELAHPLRLVELPAPEGLDMLDTNLPPEGGWTEDQSKWPAHLRDDAPYKACTKCLRKSWSRKQWGMTCLMVQPNGTRCQGVFE